MDNFKISLLHDFTGAFQHATGFLVENEAQNDRFERHSFSGQLDALVETRAPDGSICRLAVNIKRLAYPRDVRTAISNLTTYMSHALQDDGLKLCFVADEISPGSRRALREAGINYFDSSGTLYFRHKTWLVDIERTSSRPAQRKDMALFSGARERVVHALLHHRHTHPGDAYISGAELSFLAQTSTYTVSSTMQGLEQLDLVESTGSGPAQRRRVRDPAALLDTWAEEWNRRKETRTRWYSYAPNGNVTDTVIAAFGKHARTEWALTGAAAANAVVPRLTTVDRVEVIIQPDEAEKLASSTGMTQAEQGANVILVERSGASFMFLDGHPERPGSRFASRFIQYLDLLDGYGRNKELAEAFRRQALNMRSST